MSKVIVVKPPKLKKDPERLVPRIIHQVSTTTGSGVVAVNR